MAERDDDSSVDSEDWGAEELFIPPTTAVATDAPQPDSNNNDDDDYWEVEATEPPPTPADPPSTSTSTGRSNNSSSSSCMILVDLTRLDPSIHSRFDRNSVNAPEEASRLRRAIERDYRGYAGNATLVSEGTVVPCGSSVWREALVALRDDRVGHYFVPVFPPKDAAVPAPRSGNDDNNGKSNNNGNGNVNGNGT